MDDHLSKDQIDAILELASQGEGGTAEGQNLLEKPLQEHLRNCSRCQSNLQAQERAMDLLAHLRDLPKERKHGCPPEAVWTEITAGMAVENVDSLLNHATACDDCGALLRQATADCSDDLTLEEISMIDTLESSTSRWQSAMAGKMAIAAVVCAESSPLAEVERRKWWAYLIPPRTGVYAVAMLCLVCLMSWLFFRGNRGSEAGRLVADAYAEKRTMEARITSAPYAPVRRDRAGSGEESRMARPTLLKAEAEISRHLRIDSDDAVWLQASGRVSLLEGGSAGAEQALSVLNRAHALDPGNYSISVDLASAYLLRGDVDSRPEDYAIAVDDLGKILAAQPRDETAQFNYALALEKLVLNVQAAEAWQSYLKLDGSSPWAMEARQHLEILQQRIHQRSQQSGEPLLPASAVASAFAGENSQQIAAIDARMEEYQDLAARQWLAESLRPNAAPVQRELDTAVQGLSHLLARNHGDPWLEQMLAAKDKPGSVQQAIVALAESERLIQASDDRAAQARIDFATSRFQRTAFRAGLLRARFDQVFLFQLQHQPIRCQATAATLAREAAASGYAWIQTQSLLEQAACSSASDNTSIALTASARTLADEHRFPRVAIRAANFESASYAGLGDRGHAWARATACLSKFWQGRVEPLAGYNVLTTLQGLAEDQRQWFLETAVLKEAIPMIASHPNFAMRAFEEAWLGEAELRASMAPDAEAAFQQAEQLFAVVPSGARRDALRAETQVGLARAEMVSGHESSAVDRLERVRDFILQLPDEELQLDFYRASGIANLRSGNRSQAGSDLKAAIRLADRGLQHVHDEGGRWNWSRGHEPEYRALVELELSSDPTEALRDWEIFKGATLSNASANASSNALNIADTTDTAQITYAVFDRSVAIWVREGGRVREISIPFDSQTVEAQVRRFVELCSDPKSKPETINREGAALYSVILEPVEPWFAEHRRLIIEPDGIFRLLPFEILVNRQGSYLGDRYDLAISPGAEYLEQSRKWLGITASSSALVIGNPVAVGWVSLPEAEDEARAVAGQFRRADLLLRSTDASSIVASKIGQVDLFHFSGHATASAAASGLAAGGQSILGSAFLNGSERGRTQLVVLSACNSARGSEGFFDDGDSFVRRLLVSRTPAVVASRWFVDSAATARLMQSFYTALLSGERAGTALASARRSLRAQPQYAHPFYWAGFSVFGDG